MSPSNKNTIAQLTVCNELLKMGFPVTVNTGGDGDLRMYDFTFLSGDKTYKAKVRFSNRSGYGSVGTYRFKMVGGNPFRNSPEYHFDADIYFMIVHDKIFFISKEKLSGRREIMIRIDLPKGHLTSQMNMADDYILTKERLLSILN